MNDKTPKELISTTFGEAYKEIINSEEASIEAKLYSSFCLIQIKICNHCDDIENDMRNFARAVVLAGGKSPVSLEKYDKIMDIVNSLGAATLDAIKYKDKEE